MYKELKELMEQTVNKTQKDIRVEMRKTSNIINRTEKPGKQNEKPSERSHQQSNKCEQKIVSVFIR